MCTPIIWLLNVLLFLSIFALSLAGCCSGKKNKKENKSKKGTAKKKGNHKASNKKAKLGATLGISIRGPPDKSVGQQHSLFNNQPAAPANANKRASTNDPIYLTLHNVKDPFATGGEQGPSLPENATRKEPQDPQYQTLNAVQDVFANGGGEQGPAAPQHANVMADISDPNYQTLIQEQDVFKK